MPFVVRGRATLALLIVERWVIKKAKRNGHDQRLSMSEPLNSNPTILEQWQLPQRQDTKNVHTHDLVILRQLSLAPGVLRQSKQADEPDLIEDNSELSESDGELELIDEQEIFDLISNVQDPEHPLTLGQLAVVALDRIKVHDTGNPEDLAEVHVEITPTITHCSLATLIGLGLRVRLERSLPARFRIKITVTPGSHQSEQQVNKQLNDKERVAAACENEQLLKVIADMLSRC